MCTVSWLHTGDGFELFFNRDESRRRGRGEPPAAAETGDGTRFLAPRDPDAGGTWIAVNELGTAVCLLNRYEAPASAVSAPGGASRGGVVRMLAGATDAEAAVARLGNADLRPYRPFTIVALDPSNGPLMAAWDGHRLAAATVATEMPLASSGHDPGAVEGVRRAAWATFTDRDGGDDPRARLLAFHRSHKPRRGAMSPCMHRPEARTVSLSHVVVSARTVAIAYAAGSPCRARLEPQLTLARRAQRAPA